MKSIIALLLSVNLKSAIGSGTKWDYEHMSEWYHDYSMCSAQDESPINIETDNVIYDHCSSTFNWTIDWTVHKFQIHNNGHSVVLKPVESVSFEDDGDLDGVFIAEDGETYQKLNLNENTIARLPNYFLPEGSEHTEFCLDSIHFHWGPVNSNGSEHAVDGTYYPMEAHFVHYSCQHASLGTTLSYYQSEDDVLEGSENGDDIHELAVVGIFFELTDYDNPLFDAVLSEDTLENIQYPEDVTDIAAEEIVTNVYIQDIIPEEVFTDGYFAYYGSLTTPPCTNIVSWHVMNAKSYIGKAQIARFRELMYTSNHTISPNYREVQNNVNDVYACFEEYVEPDIETQAEKTERAIVWVYAVFITGAMVAFGVMCVRRAKKGTKLLTEEDPKAIRNRLPSRSSFGNSHDFSPQQSHGSAHGSTRGSTGGGH